MSVMIPDRKIKMERLLFKAIAPLLPHAKAMLMRQIKKAFRKMAKLVKSETLDVEIPFLGTIESTVVTGQEFVDHDTGNVTIYPPGTMKVTFQKHSSVKALESGKIMSGEGKVKSWLRQFYMPDGTPREDIDFGILLSDEMAKSVVLSREYESEIARSNLKRK